MRQTRKAGQITKAGRKASGVAAIELALTLPLLVLIVTGLIEYGRLMWNYDALAKATRDAARYLSTVPAANLASEASPGSATYQMVKDATESAGINPPLINSNIHVTCTPSCTVSPTTLKPERVGVAIDYPFAIGGWIPVVGMDISLVTLSPHTTMPYMK